MFAVISVHRPRPGKESLLIESMHRYGAAAKKYSGLKEVFTLKDEKQGVLIGLAIWESEDSYLAARPDLAKATEGDDFDSWESEPMKGYKVEPVLEPIPAARPRVPSVLR